MWFKNLFLFRLVEPFKLTAEELADKLAPQAFRDCGSLDYTSAGWVAPLASEEQAPLVHAGNGHLLLCARRQEKLLPPSVVNEMVAEEVRELEQQDGGRRMRRNERLAVREAIVTRLLPQALTRNRRTYVSIDPAGGRVWVDAASRNRAEDIATLLRESLGSLQLVPPSAEVSPAATLTHWVRSGDLPTGFELGDQCELRDPSDTGRVVRCRGLELDSDEVQAHLESGMQAMQVAMSWQERIGFVVDAEMTVRRLQFLDIVQQEALDVHVESEAQRFDADYAIMTLELARFIPELLAGFRAEA